MTDEEIVFSWLSIPANRDRPPTIAYTKEIFDFIVNTMDCESSGEDYQLVYKVHGH